MNNTPPVTLPGRSQAGSAPQDDPRDEDGSLTSRILRLLEADLLSGELPSGEKLKIATLKQRYNCGASPIREALSHLAAQSLVVRLENRGFLSAPLTREEFDEILCARIWLEERALKESIARGDRDWEDAIVLAHHRLRQTGRYLDAERSRVNPDWEAVHKRFHMALIAACGSTILLGFCSDLYDRNTRYRNASGRASANARDIGTEHDSLKEMTLARDYEGAIAVLREHYRRTGWFSLE
jgi:GntR family transcriptional regulator, carbon starvation induced regulator